MRGKEEKKTNLKQLFWYYNKEEYSRKHFET